MPREGDGVNQWGRLLTVSKTRIFWRVCQKAWKFEDYASFFWVGGSAHVLPLVTLKGKAPFMESHAEGEIKREERRWLTGRVGEFPSVEL